MTDEFLLAIQKDIKKNYGKDILIQAKDLLTKEQEIVHLSPALDYGLSGGVPFGSFITIAGVS